MSSEKDKAMSKKPVESQSGSLSPTGVESQDGPLPKGLISNSHDGSTPKELNEPPCDSSTQKIEPQKMVQSTHIELNSSSSKNEHNSQDDILRPIEPRSGSSKTVGVGSQRPFPKDQKVGGILKPLARKPIPRRKNQDQKIILGPRSRHEESQKVISFNDVLVLARDHFGSIASPSRGCKPGIEEFFCQRGFSIKITHKEQDAAAASAASTDIDGLFVISDSEVPISGIVIDAIDNFKVLVMPLPDVSREENALKFCLRNLQDYDIYRALDGTRVTLYYVERLKTWLLATTNSYDARNYKWMGPKTYMELLMECLPEGFSFDTLDKTAHYSFIFRHCEFHPLIRDPPHEIWQIAGPQVPHIAQYTPIPESERVDGEQMRFRARQSFIEYAQKHTVNYGFILRRRGSIEVEKNNGPMAVYLESSLHEFVRKHIYDIPSAVTGLTYETRPIFLHLRGYMSLGSNSAYLIMFPQAGDIYNKMDFVIVLLTDMTVAEMRASSKTQSSASASSSASSSSVSRSSSMSAEQVKIGEKLFGESWKSVSEYILLIVKSSSARLISSNQMGVFGDHIHANIRDHYLNVVNTFEFLKILTMK